VRPVQGDADVSGPAWLTGGFAALMIMVAVCSAGRLAVSRVRGRDTELDTDGLHVLMGVAMAGMLEQRLSPVPGTIWRAVFAAAAAWFAWQAIRARSARPGGSRCAHPAPHAVECAAMVYMLLPAGSRPAGRAPGMAMPGMNGGAAAGNPALTLVLALFMLGYILWTIDRLASLSRARATVTAHGAAAGSPTPAALTASATARAPGTASPGTIADGGAPGRLALAPRLATGYKIAMGIGMGYMLIMML
jgi:Domain of unknown function (DUF5134)